MNDSICRRLIVHGRVQGVGYRYWTVGMVEALRARGLPITGWVRNRATGTVEILACGVPAAIDALVEACRQGPPAAKVGRIEILKADGAAAAPGFEQRPTA